MILVYTHKITPRLRYAFKHIFTRILLIEVDFTSKVEDFVAFNGPKMSYTKIPLGGEFFVKSNDLLFEQGVEHVDIKMLDWQGVPCFFSAGSKSTIPFDVFAASFYLVSRYEEYLPHVKDSHGRFIAEKSLAFIHNFLEKPVVDIWAYMLLAEFKTRFPDYVYKTKEYHYTSVIAVNNAYAYKHKSLVRVIGGFFRDLYKLKILSLWNRFTVSFNFKKDPFDTFQKILDLKKEFKIKTIFFFQVGSYTTFDTNISASKRKFKLLIKNVVDYAKVGLLASYYSTNNSDVLKAEKERLESIINLPVKRSIQHYTRFVLPNTYQKLIDLEVEEDYSMVYPKNVGFRASTCTPFYFYDLDFEIQTPLKIFPIAVMDSTLNYFMGLTPKQSLGKIRDLKNEVCKVNGSFITLFHNDSLSGSFKWRGWKYLYASTLKITT